MKRDEKGFALIILLIVVVIIFLFNLAVFQTSAKSTESGQYISIFNG